MSAPPVVIGVGNRYRRDDGSALRVVDALATRVPAGTVVVESDGEPARLIDSWADATLAIVIETVRQGTPPGSVSEIEWDERLSNAINSEHGSHSLGIAEAIALGRVVDRMPRKLRILGIEPGDLGWGEGLSDAVSRSINDVVELVLAYLR